MKNVFRKILSATLLMARATATLLGLTVMPALKVGLPSAALAASRGRQAA